jgi:hypothetical protein
MLLGLVIGAVDVLLMLPLWFPDRRAAIADAFCARFALGFFAATVRLPLPPVVAGVVLGLLRVRPRTCSSPATTVAKSIRVRRSSLLGA